ncbi:MAG: hypothetical protein JRI72_06925 [Deltaproteobacteria bacterium]|nr:hypothetical protein [Deltaproteobacteria bacterium]
MRLHTEGDSMSLFGREKFIPREKFEAIIHKLAKSLGASREEYILGSLTQLKREGVDVSNVPREISSGSELEDALKGFELTCIMGIAWNYIKSIEDQLSFDNALCAHINAEKGSRAWNFRERYTDCQGNMDALATALSIDVYKSIGSPRPENEYKDQFNGRAYFLVGICQADTYSACGDTKMEKKVRAKIKMYLK